MKPLTEILDELRELELTVFLGDDDDLTTALETHTSEFKQQVADALAAHYRGDLERLAVLLFEIGKTLGRDEYRRLKVKDYRHREGCSVGGKQNATELDDKRRQLKIWNRQIKARMKERGIPKTRAMVELGIPRSTFDKWTKQVGDCP